MNRSNISTTLLNRELGLNHNTGSASSTNWSHSNCHTIQFSYLSGITSTQYKQEYLVVLTKNAEAFLFDSFSPRSLERIFDSTYRVLKVTFLGNNRLFVISKQIFSQFLNFSIFRIPLSENPPVQILTDHQITLENLDQCDIFLGYLTFISQDMLILFDLSTLSIKYQCPKNYLYLKDHVLLIERFQIDSRVNINHFNTDLTHSFTFTGCRSVSVLDILDEVFVLSKNGALCTMNMITEELIVVSTNPDMYFVGKNMSAAVYRDFMILMNKSNSRVDMVPDVFCADLIGIVVIFERRNMRIASIRDNGEILQVIPINSKVVYISVNSETMELAVACKNYLMIFE